ncbi:magnesium transporter [Geosporobacter ferrireducens]|uniref:Magnesium transporter MgtE n=1 Tax=Geosporobacter ferrireducens TaxID=1424294 RepID=A0A1D8GIC5_9FIRM|nr:magnesium transporter [Geosporobacter ferrireducens]AOT70649.1 magnesium transporter [Geosporobacter ferrireducens]MTI57447.1 magnesium transporter [Geosporobacter ferrireducens]
MFEEKQETLIDGVKENDRDKIYGMIDNMYPIDIAIILEEFDDKSLLKFFSLIDDALMAEIIEQASEELQVRMIKLFDFKAIVSLFSYMSNDDIADILGNLPIQMRKDLLKMMKDGDTQQLQELLGYEEDSAGGIMTTEYIALKGDLTIGESLKKIKEIGPKTEVIETIFVLNKNKGLIGTADLRDILIAPEDKKLIDIMNDNVISVNPEEDQEKVSLLVSKYDLKAIPVINHKRSLLGIITVDDIIDVIIEEQTEDMLRLGGVSKEERVDSALTTSIKKRLPWLFINLGTAFLAAFTVGLFEDVIAQVVALAAAMPIVAGMGGNAGTQTLSVVIRSIALGEVSLKKNWKLVFKEIALGVINGATTGILTGIILYMKYGNPYLGLIIFAAMIGNLVIAGFFGFLIPLLLKVFGIDPALASAIFLTTATDVFGFFLFLGLAKMFLPLLM